MQSISVPDALRCPLCGMTNGCEMEMASRAGTTAPSTCWCMTATFDDALLARVPAVSQGSSCICARCAADAQR
ncbi:cysteine-rich CWC family protein [Variovorax guangxiensis]|uniref:Cysteine-rich CWC family protein n=1 Tax=Variovorax guangxiensis TaxID=1775474 RepID=A0A502DIP6_9BURK|nr:cysteine-rich CWC family protein [Variovorax guangxiensis]TPG20308.1 hypothetical protein EAH83_18850 [Variovorax ginsengisoli]TPG23966.1 hypothetical protein EAH82_18515 [Variovorax guangxiensis]